MNEITPTPEDWAALREIAEEYARPPVSLMEVDPREVLHLMDNQQAPKLTGETTAALRAALTAVGGGPWTAVRDEPRLEWWVCCEQFGPILNAGYVGNNDARPLAQLLASMFNDLPALLDELEQLRALHPTAPAPPVPRTFDERMAFEQAFDANIEAHRKAKEEGKA